MIHKQNEKNTSNTDNHEIFYKKSVKVFLSYTIFVQIKKQAIPV